MEFTYKPSGVCASEIKFIIENNKIYNIIFTGGCNGNLKAISSLLDGCDAKDIISKLSGNTCGRRPSSCADQLAIAVQKAYKKYGVK